MVSIHSSAVLVVAKIRSQKGRTLLSVVVAGILFGFLLGAIIVEKAFIGSVETYSDATTDGRHLVLASTIDTSDDSLSQNTSLIKQAQKTYDEIVSQKKAYASSLGIAYSGQQEEKPIQSTVDAKGQKVTTLNLASPISQKVLAKYRASRPSQQEKALKDISNPYHPKKIYDVQGLALKSGSLSSPKADSTNPSNPSGQLFSQGQLPYVVDKSVLQPFLLPGAATSATNSIPIVAPYSVVQAKLGLKKLPKNASPIQKLTRLKQVRQQASNLTFSLCYRNDISKQQIDQTKLPQNNSCAAPKILASNRTAEQKTYDQKKAQFDQHFGIEYLPKQRLISFRVIGITPDNRTGTLNDSLPQVALSLLKPPGFGFATTSTQDYRHLKQTAGLNDIFSLSPSISSSINLKNYLIEFNSFNDMASFLQDNSCKAGDNCSGIDSFNLSQFGSSSLQLAAIKQTVQAIFLWIAAVVAFIAVVILGGTFSKIIAESRKETAVFRSIGATRADIIVIYQTYATYMAGFTSLFAVVIGYAVALFFHIMFANQLALELQLTYGANHSGIESRLVSFPLVEISLIILLIFATSLLTMFLSLIKSDTHSIATSLKEE